MRRSAVSRPAGLPWRGEVMVAGALVLALLGLDRLLPPPDPTAGGFARVVAARDGTPLRVFPDARGVWRLPLAVDEVDLRYLEALLAYEDRRFRLHPGVDPLALLRATVQNLLAGEVVSGGSTLTMQVVRLAEPRRRTLAAKAVEVLRALQLEWRLGKEGVLRRYLETAPYGGTLVGLRAASRAYLGKEPRTLTDAEAALLAVLPQRPSALRPDRHPQRARRARDKVLHRLAATGVWSAARVRAATAEPIAARRLRPPLEAPLLARRLVREIPGEGAVRSTLDAGLQRQVAALLAEETDGLPRGHALAALVVRNADLSAAAYVGTADFADASRYGHVDMVQAVRSPGSTLKPFVYGLALDDGLVHSASLLWDLPRHGHDYRPGNFGGGYRGAVSVAGALRRSLNVPAVQLTEAVGPRRFAARLENAGLRLHGAGAASPSAAVVLGGVGVRLEDLAAAYTALGRRGRGGPVRLHEAAPLRERHLLSPGAAWIVHRMLRRPPYPGPADDRWRLAWKTGTSYGFRDAWAVGVTHRWTLLVWSGRPDGTASPGRAGRRAAAPVLFRLHALVEASAPSPVLPRPDAVTRATICWPLGTRLADPRNRESCHRRHTAWLVDGAAPRTLPPPWEGGPAGRSAPLELDLGAPDDPGGRLRIVAPAPGGLLRAPPGGGAPSIALRAHGGDGTRHWYVDGRWVGSGASVRVALARSGPHRIAVVDGSGRRAVSGVTVAPP